MVATLSQRYRLAVAEQEARDALGVLTEGERQERADMATLTDSELAQFIDDLSPFA